MPGEPTALARRPDTYVWDPRRLEPGHEVELLVGGPETYAAMLDAIRSAQHSVLAEVYILRGDDVGRVFADALIERARAGVACFLLYDAIGSIGLDPLLLADMTHGGCHVAAYRPLGRFLRRFAVRPLTRRNHRKLLVVDGAVAFVGGINFGEEYTTSADGAAGWHDVNVRVAGRVAHALALSFRTMWGRARGLPAPPEPPPPSSPGSTFVAPLENRDRGNRMAIRRAYLHAIAVAEREILIQNAYFIPDIGLRWALRRACRRGVSIKVIVPSSSDVPMVQWASRHLYGKLLDMGVRLFAWRGGMMHAKAAVIDQAWVTVGSYNLDDRSLFHNLELNVVVADASFGASTHTRLAADLDRCDELTLAGWVQRPAWARLLEWIVYRFKRWL